MEIHTVRRDDELDAVLRLTWDVFPRLAELAEEGNYSRASWFERVRQAPDLLLYAEDGGVICGSVFGFVEDGTVTIAHCWVDARYRGQGLGRALMLEEERRARALGCRGIALGAVEAAEGFYEKLGYTGTLLIQSTDYTTEQLLALHTPYEVVYTGVYEGKVNQVFLRLPSADRALQREYEKTFPGCSTQMVFGKTF